MSSQHLRHGRGKSAESVVRYLAAHDVRIQTETNTMVQAWDLPCKPGGVSLNSRAHIKERKKAGWPDTGVLRVISALEMQTDRLPVSPAKPASTRPVSSTQGTGLSLASTHVMPMYPHKHTKL